MIDKIKAEADAIVCEKEQRIKELEQALAEALTQNEWSRSVVEEYHSENIACEEAMNELVFILKQPESTALAALKAEWQADALGDFYDHLQGMALRNGWGTDSDAYNVSEELKYWCQRAQEAGE